MKLYAALSVVALCGCTIAPHGSRATHTIKTYYREDGTPRLRIERFTDRSAGGGRGVLCDVTTQNVAIFHTNSVMQTGGWFTMGNGTLTTDPQASGVVAAVGTAVGNVVGAALKTAVKP